MKDEIKNVALLKAKVEKLEQEKRELINLLSIVAHDLKQPIGSIVGFSDIILDKNLETETLEIMNIIKSASASSIHLLDSLYLYVSSRSFANKNLNSKISLSKNIEISIKKQAVSASLKNIKLIVETVPDVKIICESVYFISVIDNIISNAIKFSNINSQIHIFMETNETMLRVFIKDLGIGMEKDRVREILSSTSILKSEIGTEKEVGTGFGLMNVKSFIKHWGGKFYMSSNKDTGTIISFSVPLA